MSNIKILDSFTANQIAAGEVVERPASVVKELCENALDANASAITVSIQSGGITAISVIDNGTGMDREDAKLAFLRHATSKITSVMDFDTIKTMGFRGEALASIAAVSKVTLKTKQIGESSGTIVRIEDGSIIEHSPSGCSEGTNILIEYLFYNTPARYKFLKKDSTETSYITDILERFILSRPDVSFRLFSNNQEILHSPGNNDLKSAIFSVYGKNVVDGLIPINYKTEYFEVDGFIGKPEICKSTRQQQSIFVNNRYIKSRTISAAIEEGYKTLLMKGKFTFCVLNYKISPSLIDVNVHPQKTEIKFWNDNEAFLATLHAVKEALATGISIQQMHYNNKESNNTNPRQSNELGCADTVSNLQEPEIKYQQIEINNNNNNNNNRKTSEIDRYDLLNLNNNTTENAINSNNNQNPSYNSNFFKDAQTNPVDSNFSRDINVINSNFTNFIGADNEIRNDENNNIAENQIVKEPTDIYKSNEDEDVKNSMNLNDNSPNEQFTEYDNFKKINESETKSNNSEIKINELANAKYLGSLFNTYLLLEIENNFIMIDQHAAHERILFEKLVEKYKNHIPIAQQLITPELIELTSREIVIVKDEITILSELGFECEIFGVQTILLRTVPFDSAMLNLKGAFSEILDLISNQNNIPTEETISNALYSIACKAAVKAKENLNLTEIDHLISELQRIPNPTHCPHGRPVLMKMSKYEIEKNFKRIVT